jgi:tRNA-modifying protein YgfZ
MYVMRSKVEIKDVSNSIIKFGINGLEAAQILAPSFTETPTEDYQLITLENGAILKLPSTNGARFEIFTDSTNAPIIWEALKANCNVVDKAHWDWLEIQAGIPDIELKTQEKFVPQMLNLDILNGINFKKGCYTGQEIVARTHYLGAVKRRTYLASIQSASAPQAGDRILDSTQNEAGVNEVGQIVRVAPNLESGFDVLAEMRIDAQAVGNVTCNGLPITFKTPPYALDA